MRATKTPTRPGRWLAFLAAVQVLGAGAHAHHSQAPFFDQSRDVEIEGVVQRFDFRNPHAILYVETQGEDGDSEVWSLQFASLAILIRVGITAETFRPGERVVAVGHPARNPDALGMAGVAVTKADGSEIVDPLRSGAFAPAD